MNKLIRVQDIMQKAPLCLKPETEINAALRQLLAKDISGAPVVGHQGDLIGILTIKDCIQAALDAHYHREWGDSVSTYMSHSVDTLEPGMELVKAAHYFTHSQYRRFPVVDGEQLVGQVSRVDVLQALCDSW